MLFRQLFDPDTSTYTYLLADEASREAILIDTVKEQVDRDAGLLEDLGLKLVATLETHVHADHVTGAWLLAQRFGSAIVYPAGSGVTVADRLIDEGESVRFGHHEVFARRTPGHTAGCTTYVTEDLAKAFTGDALLIRGSGRTDFQQGDAATLFRSVRDQIFTLPDHTEIYPGHDYKGRTVSTVGEERAFNPRLGQANSEADFVRIMEALDLAYPRHIDRALPANLALGREAGDEPVAVSPDPWDALPWSGGVRHVTPEWVAEHCAEVDLVDVRQPDEWVGALQALPKAKRIPLNQVAQASAAWDLDRPLVLICRSSGRSDAAARALGQLGFKRVASMVGGMMSWYRADLRGGCEITADRGASAAGRA